MKKSKRALVIVGHGSRQKGFQAAMEKVAKSLRRGKDFDEVRCAYLEITPPSVLESVHGAVSAGASEIRILPYFLLKGRHTEKDLPALAEQARSLHKKVRIVLCPYLGHHRKIEEVVRQRARQRS